MHDGDAQVFLLAMQNRLQADPRLALGLAPTANAAEARTAFLTLTKQYHPIKFARCDAAVQRLANEVFLLLREAHDAVVKNARSASGTGPAVGRAPTPRTTQNVTVPGVTVPRTISPPNSQSPTIPAAPGQVAKVAAPAAKPAAPPAATARPAPTKLQPAPATTAKPSVPKPLLTTPSIPASMPASTPALSNVTFRHAPTPASPITPSTVDESELFTKGKELLRHKQWHEARDVFVALTRQNNVESAYQAMLALARGRIDQADGNLEGARTQYALALQLEPAFTAAATALDEIGPAESKTSLWAKLRGK
ncbi:MAG: hypothetical protein KBG15_24220 [Kofleriaceae bacterium]|nr:hypothetical protein [Kofleriaceae bacterium]